MKPSELRTGNLDFQPIPLTEEWLVKLGFAYRDDDGIIMYQKESVLIFHKFRMDFFFQLDLYEKAPIEYVHQLQNLYFALTGTELEIK